MNQFRSFISQYTSNAAERVACHYKERSLMFRIVASRVLSRAPSSPSSSIRPAAHSICRVSLRMAAPQQKVFCVLEFARTNSVVKSLFETLNYALCNGMRLFPWRCLCTAEWIFEIGSFFMKNQALQWSNDSLNYCYTLANEWLKFGNTVDGNWMAN
jgi:hypothetical protein